MKNAENSSAYLRSLARGAAVAVREMTPHSALTEQGQQLLRVGTLRSPKKGKAFKTYVIL